MIRTIQQVLSEHMSKLMASKGVVGTAEGLCDGAPCIKVYIKKDAPELRKDLPATIEGYPVSVEVVGDIRAFS